jgi:ribonucleoside-diphosphate reductase beta chain
MSAIQAVNWNRPDDDFTLMFWNQNIMQFWTDDEIPLSDDKMSWLTLSELKRTPT